MKNGLGHAAHGLQTDRWSLKFTAPAMPHIRTFPV
jgi:hypothetical protein